ncbi:MULTISPECIES: hypothetical protein [unclassified Curtobacterium]|uniref:hypothetical protein n=1 Tax=unclassified Curtobacterium TaxID=257496 RepID=UPI003A805305
MGRFSTMGERDTTRTPHDLPRILVVGGRGRSHDDEPGCNAAPGQPAVPLPLPSPDTVFHVAKRRGDERERLMMRLAADCGMRRAEIAVAHSDDVYGDILGWTLVVHSKGGRRRNVSLTRGLATVLRDQPHGFFFPGDEDRHLSPRWVGKLIIGLLDAD